MKTNFNKSLKKNKPVYIHSVFYPAPGFVATPQNKHSGFKGKRTKKLTSPKQALVSTIDLIKPIVSNITSIFKNGKRG